MIFETTRSEGRGLPHSGTDLVQLAEQVARGTFGLSGQIGRGLARTASQQSQESCGLGATFAPPNRLMEGRKMAASARGVGAERVGASGAECGARTPVKIDETFSAGLRFNGYARFEGGKRGAMVLRMTQQLEIEDLRNHSAETVEKLRHLLASGAPAQPDPHRENFYEVGNCSQVFYVYIAPSNGRVWLLATWPKDGQPAVSSTATGDRPA